MFLLSQRRMAIPKLFSVTAENQLQLVALLMRGNQRLVLPLFPTLRVLRNPSREFWIVTTLKLLKSLFRLWGIFFAKPKDPVTKEQRTDATFSIPCNHCDNEYSRQIKRQFDLRFKEHQKAVFFCKKENSALSEHTCLTNHTVGWDNLKLSPLIGVITSAFIWKPGILTPPTLL